MTYAANIFREWYVAQIHQADCAHVSSLASRYESIGGALYGAASNPNVQVARPAKCCLEDIRVIAINLDHGGPVQP